MPVPRRSSAPPLSAHGSPGGRPWPASNGKRPRAGASRRPPPPGPRASWSASRRVSGSPRRGCSPAHPPRLRPRKSPRNRGASARRNAAAARAGVEGDAPAEAPVDAAPATRHRIRLARPPTLRQRKRRSGAGIIPGHACRRRRMDEPGPAEAPAPENAEARAAALEAGRRLFARPCRFVAGVAGPDGLPAPTLPEIAFAGRSNVGKSSLVNALTGQRALARISNTPGRTRELNFFDLDGRLTLVDLRATATPPPPDRRSRPGHASRRLTCAAGRPSGVSACCSTQGVASRQPMSLSWPHSTRARCPSSRC